MAAVADFLKGTVTSAFEKLVKPAGLVPATALVLLNLAFIYPTARADELGWAVSFSKLASGWQLVVLVALILAIGLLLQGAAVAVISVLQGYAWRDTPLGRYLESRQRAKLVGLRRELANADEREKQTLAWTIERRFGVEAETPNVGEALDPTALGNALRALQHTVDERYGIDIVTLLGHMETAKEVKESPALARVKEERDGLDLFANLAAVLSFFALECLAFFGEREDWNDALVGALALPVAYAAYHVAVAKTRSWADAVAALFDLHRGELRSQLELRKPTSVKEELELWEQASLFFRPPNAKNRERLFFEAQPPPTAKLSVAGDLVASLEQAKIVEQRGGEIVGWTPLESISYRILVGRTSEAASGAGSEVLVDDPRIAVIDAEPASDGATAVILDDGASVAVRWGIDGLGRGSSRVLAYGLSRWAIRVEPMEEESPLGVAGALIDVVVGAVSPAPAIVFARVQDRHFRLAASGPVEDQLHSITVRYLGAPGFTPPRLTQAGETMPAQIGQRSAHWAGISFAETAGAITLELPEEKAAR